MENLANKIVNNNNPILFAAMTENKDQWLKVTDVAHQLSVSTVTVHRLVQRGELVGHKIGKLLKFRPEDIEEYIKRTRTDQK